jgi:hypothetical protein
MYLRPGLPPMSRAFDRMARRASCAGFARFLIEAYVVDLALNMEGCSTSTDPWVPLTFQREIEDKGPSVSVSPTLRMQPVSLQRRLHFRVREWLAIFIGHRARNGMRDVVLWETRVAGLRRR